MDLPVRGFLPSVRGTRQSPHPRLEVTAVYTRTLTGATCNHAAALLVRHAPATRGAAVDLRAPTHGAPRRAPEVRAVAGEDRGSASARRLERHASRECDVHRQVGEPCHW